MTEPTANPVTTEVIQSLVDSINAKFSVVDSANSQIAHRLETLIKLLCQTGSVTHSSFVDGLRQFVTYSQKIEELKKIGKLSERLKVAVGYNESIATTSAMEILADDIDVLKDVVNADTISKDNYTLCAKLPMTDLFRALISKYVEESESFDTKPSKTKKK